MSYVLYARELVSLLEELTSIFAPGRVTVHAAEEGRLEVVVQAEGFEEEALSIAEKVVKEVGVPCAEVKRHDTVVVISVPTL